MTLVENNLNLNLWLCCCRLVVYVRIYGFSHHLFFSWSKAFVKHLRKDVEGKKSNQHDFVLIYFSLNCLIVPNHVFYSLSLYLSLSRKAELIYCIFGKSNVVLHAECSVKESSRCTLLFKLITDIIKSFCFLCNEISALISFLFFLTQSYEEYLEAQSRSSKELCLPVSILSKLVVHLI